MTVYRRPWNKGISIKDKPYFHKWFRPLSQEIKDKISKANKGKLCPSKGRRGEKSSRWKGGRSTLTHKIRTSLPYLKWRSDVYKRDGWTCQTCGFRGHGRDIEAHHIIPMSEIIKGITELETAMSLTKLFDVDNGVTLCKSCHILTFEDKHAL
jgi:5-methylcytosine-specific restriction endonuclease McrA